MGIPMNSLCLECRLHKDLDTARSLGDAQTATAFAKAHLKLFLEMKEGENSAYFGAQVDALFRRFYHLEADRFREEKAQSNQFVLQRLEQLRRRVAAAEDPIYAATQLAILGNYIDFSALRGEVSFQALEAMLDSAAAITLDRAVFDRFLADLRKGKKLLYITDNAGEIGFDRVLAECLIQAFPHLEITFCVRGLPVSNDATREDAEAVGIPFPVIDSGCAIGGTVVELLSPEAKQALETADVVLAKGMGNTESMYGCGYNVYYAFLIKCDRFIEFFGKPKLSSMFIRELDQ